MRTYTKRYRNRLFPAKSCVVTWGPTKWVDTEYLHPIIKDKIVRTQYLDYSPDKPKRLFWKD